MDGKGPDLGQYIHSDSSLQDAGNNLTLMSKKQQNLYDKTQCSGLVLTIFQCLDNTLSLNFPSVAYVCISHHKVYCGLCNEKSDLTVF